MIGNNELEGMWKEGFMTLSKVLPYSDISLERLKKTTTNLDHSSRFSVDIPTGNIQNSSQRSYRFGEFDR
jgi:hypothetical protein